MSIIPTIIIIGYAIFSIISNHLNTQEGLRRADLEYPTLQFSDSINAVVVGVYDPPGVRGTSFFMSVDFLYDVKYSLHVKDMALEQPQKDIRDVCVAGATVKKKAFSDTLEVNRGGVQFTFLIKRDD